MVQRESPREIKLSPTTQLHTWTWSPPENVENMTPRTPWKPWNIRRPTCRVKPLKCDSLTGRRRSRISGRHWCWTFALLVIRAPKGSLREITASLLWKFKFECRANFLAIRLCQEGMKNAQCKKRPIWKAYYLLCYLCRLFCVFFALLCVEISRENVAAYDVSCARNVICGGRGLRGGQPLGQEYFHAKIKLFAPTKF